MPFHSTFKANNTYFTEHTGDCALHGGYKTHYKLIKRTPKTIILQDTDGIEKRYKIKSSSLDCNLTYECVDIGYYKSTRLYSYNCNNVNNLDKYFNERNRKEECATKN